MIDFIHVGDYKTGTSWLQKYFYPIHPEINYFGGPFVDNDLEHQLHIMVDSRDLDFNGDILRKNISPLMKNINGKKSGICREVFSGSDYISCDNAKQNAERIKAVFGNIKVIFVIREQLSMLLSIYSQYLKIGGTLKLNDFIFDPIVSRGLIERLQWHKQVKMYYDLFGQENVHIALFEDFVNDKQSFLNKICDYLEIQHLNISHDNKAVNKKLTNYGSIISRKGNKFFRSKYNNSKRNNLAPILIELFTSKRKLISLINDTEKRIVPNYNNIDYKNRKTYALNWRGIVLFRRISEKIKWGNSLTIPKEMDELLKNYFKESNCILRDQYNLPVEKYNYSI